MPDIDHNPNQPASDSHPANIVTIESVSLPIVEIDGQRVVTLAMIDKVHQRPDGTARRNFNENRTHLVAAEDYRELTADEIRAQSLGHVFAPRTPKGIVLTETGYLMLVKSFTDDLAWQVQRSLVKSYFTKLVTAPARRPRIDLSRECRLSMSQNLKLAKMIGLTGNQAAMSANRATVALTGVDTLSLMGVTHMTAPQNEVLLSPTEIGQRFNLGSARDINRLLCSANFQKSFRDAKGDLYYEPTEQGLSAGGVMQDTGKRHGNGTPVRQLRWASSIGDVLRAGRVQARAA